MEDECNSAITSSGQKCIYNNEKKICEIKEICEIENHSIICEKIQTSNPIKTKCVYDENEGKCKIKNKTCSEITFGATNEIFNSIKVFNNKIKKCVFNNNRCNIINGISVINVRRNYNYKTDYYELSISEGEEFAIEYGVNAIPYDWVLKNHV